MLERVRGKQRVVFLMIVGDPPALFAVKTANGNRVRISKENDLRLGDGDSRSNRSPGVRGDYDDIW